MCIVDPCQEKELMKQRLQAVQASKEANAVRNLSIYDPPYHLYTNIEVFMIE